MRIALIGASGHAGSRILTELADRGHRVTAICRHPETVPPRQGVTTEAGDVSDPQGLTAVLAGHDVAVSAVPFYGTEPEPLIAAVKAAAVPRYLVVGTAGSLFVAPGLRLLDAPDFPDGARDEASRGAIFLHRLKEEPSLDWTILTPPVDLAEGARTGAYRTGAGELIVGGDGHSRISYADYAVALADEIERPAHRRARFTVGY